MGLILPKERIETRLSTLNAPPETIYNTITNNKDWHYRTGLKNLITIEKKGDFEAWSEIAEDGNVIQFETKEKIPYSYYSFTM